MSRVLQSSIRSWLKGIKQLHGKQQFSRRFSDVVNKHGEIDMQKFDPNKPIPYISSGLYKTSGVRRPTPETFNPDMTNYYIIAGSLSVFLIYFCILRTGHEIDEKLDGDSFNFLGPEYDELRKEYQYNMKNRLPNDEVIRKLKALNISPAFLPPETEFRANISRT